MKHVKPIAILDDGSSCPLEVSCTTSLVHGQRVNQWHVWHQQSSALSIRKIRLFDVDLQCKQLQVFAGGFYMPSDASGYYNLRAGEPAPAGTPWKIQGTNDYDFVCHTMATLQAAGDDEHQLIGFTSFETWHAYLLFHTQGKSLRCSAWCDLHFADIKPGQKITLESFMLNTGDDHPSLLAHYADHLAKAHHPRVAPDTITGWIDWQYYREEKTAADVLRTVDALKQLRTQGFDHQYIIIDGGWCNHASEWLMPCDKFPDGMKDMATRLHDQGFKFGLWFAPYLTNVNTKVVLDHPEWLVKDRTTGKPLYKASSNVGPCHVIDFSIPKAQDWLRDVVSTMVKTWGIDYLKLDGPCLAHYNNAVFADPQNTPVKQVRTSLQIIREACGQDVVIEGEGIYGPSIGMVDVQRTTQDSSTHWYSEAGVPYAKTNMKDDLASSWLHRKLWQNHRENIILRDFCSPFHAGKVKHPNSRDGVLTKNQMRFQLTATTLAGGAQLLSDPVEELIRNPGIISRLAQLRPHVQAPSCQAIDIDHNQTPSFYHLPVQRAGELGHVLAVFNWTDQYQNYQLPLAFAGQGAKPNAWHVHEFWESHYCGSYQSLADSFLSVMNVPAHGCRLFALTADHDRPTLAGSDVHLYQGACELERQSWQDDTLELDIRHFYQINRTLTIARPSGYRLVDVTTNAVNHLIDSREDGLIRIHYSGPSLTSFKLRWQQGNGS